MISVSFSASGECIGVSAMGHANTAPHGQDIVCAAVSALLCTLAAVLEEAEERGKLISLDVKLGHGDVEILCKPKAPYGKEVTAWFEFTERGIAILAEQYPESIVLSISGAADSSR